MQKSDSKSATWSRGGAALTLAVALFAVATTPLQAQDSEGEGQAVTVNLDVLYNLDEGPIPGQARAAPTPLLPAPSQAPRSRLLVAPAPKPTPALAAVPESAPTEAEEPNVAEPPSFFETAEQTAEPSPEPQAQPLPPAPPPAPDLGAQPAPEAIPTAPSDNGVAQDLDASPPVPQTAALPPGPVPTLDSPIRLLFGPESASLSDATTKELSDLAARLLGAQGQRIQLLAYADANEGGNSLARRLSLSRALSVRSYLVAEGVSSSQIDVRALGAKYEEGPPDRVDVVYVSR